MYKLFSYPDSKHLTKAFTLFEVTLTITIIFLMLIFALTLLNLPEYLKKGRDNRRLHDLNNLERIVSEYRLDFGSYPDSESMLRYSNITTTEGKTVESANRGWLNVDLTKYNTTLPVDPLNSEQNRYRYVRNSTSYEIDATLEYYSDKSSSDGGNNPLKYEVGSDLSLLN